VNETRHTVRRLVQGALVGLTCLLAACSGAGAADDLPRLHVLRVNESDAQALAGAREAGEAAVEGCRAAQHMAGPGPAIPEAALAKLVFFQDEAWYDGPKVAHYRTIRSIAADSGSGCKPYVLVRRDVVVTDGCTDRIVGTSGNDLNTVPPGSPPPWQPSTTTEPAGHSLGCEHKGKPPVTDGVAADSAANGVACVWRSRLLSALTKGRVPAAPGNGPAAQGSDDCLYQAIPRYQSGDSPGEDVVLRTRATEASAGRAAAQMPISGGHSFFEGNTKLAAMDKGGPASGKFDKSAVDAFVRQSPKEGV
jgi:hypothetical protein